MNRTIGIVLIILGAIGLVWGGISYTTKDTVIDAGPIQVTRQKSHSIPLPPIAGAVALIGGLVVLAATKKA